MPMKDPATGCPNMCPVQCGENDQVCPGYVDATGCQTPDTCMMKDGKDIWSRFTCYFLIKSTKN